MYTLYSLGGSFVEFCSRFGNDGVHDNETSSSQQPQQKQKIRQPSFMNIRSYREKERNGRVRVPKRADLLNRIENFLISMSHSFKQHADEQLKQMRELSEQVEIIMQQLDLLKRKLSHLRTSGGGSGGGGGNRASTSMRLDDEFDSERSLHFRRTTLTP